MKMSTLNKTNTTKENDIEVTIWYCYACEKNMKHIAYCDKWYHKQCVHYINDTTVDDKDNFECPYGC